jgi:FkbH-like protein
MTVQDIRDLDSRLDHRGVIKCVVWDLDGTLWDGTIVEDEHVEARAPIVELIRELDQLGMLQSIASKNDHHHAMARLRALGLADYFLNPEMNWGPKSASLRRIASSLNIGIDALAFIDDQRYELAEVQHGVPEVLCVDAAEILEVARLPAFRPRFVTAESRERRRMYVTSAARDESERAFNGTSEEFLATLGMTLTIRRARQTDLQRAEELTVRTNQLNSTGRSYGYDELEAMRASDRHLLLVASLEDRFGSYGTIGLAVIEKDQPDWHLRLLLVSCRVVSRGIGTVLLHHVLRLAGDEGAGMRADFVDSGRNRMMHVAYAFAGFREVGREGDAAVLRRAPTPVPPCPTYLEVVER